MAETFEESMERVRWGLVEDVEGVLSSTERGRVNAEVWETWNGTRAIFHDVETCETFGELATLLPLSSMITAVQGGAMRAGYDYPEFDCVRGGAAWHAEFTDDGEPSNYLPLTRQ